MNADAGWADFEDEGFVAGDEYALFVEHAVIRQGDLVVERGDFSAVKNSGRVEGVLADQPRRSSDDNPVLRNLAGDSVQEYPAVFQKMLFQDQVFRRITGQGEFGKNDDRGPGLPGVASHPYDLLDVRDQRADCDIHLYQRDNDVLHDKNVASFHDCDNRQLTACLFSRLLDQRRRKRLLRTRCDRIE